MKKITLVFLFLIGTISATYGQFSENFDAGITAPAGWSVINGGGANTFIFGVGSPGSAFSSPNAAQINYNATAHDDYLVTPQIAVTAGLNDRLTYYVKNQDPLYVEAYEVKVSTTTATVGDFTEVVTPEADAPGTWTQFTIDLTPYVGQSIYIGFHAVSTDKFRLLFDNVVNDTPPSLAPLCAANPVSAPNATCGNFSSTISWDAAAGSTGYNLTVGTSSGATDVVNNINVGNVLTYNLPTQTPGTTYYWKVVPFNGIGSATGCTENSYITFATGCYCASVPTSNDNLGVTNVLLGTTNVPNGDVTYFDNTATVVNFPQGVPSNVQITFAAGYTYNTNIWIDFNNDFDFNDAGELVKTGIASLATNPTTLDASFDMQVTAPLGQHRMRIGTADDEQIPPDPCYSGVYGVTLDFTVNIVAPLTDSPDFVNLQFPATLNFAEGGSGVVYGRVYEAGLTNTTSGQAPGITAWVGISPVGVNSNPNTWTTWVPATFNVETGNDDEYQATIGATLVAGTYYYATRFRLNGGAYVYGGKNPSADGGSFWDGTTFVSGVLTVTPPIPPLNDECANPIALTPGGVFADNAISGTMLASTLTAGVVPSCQPSVKTDVWYTVQVPASGNITIETQASPTNSLTDTVVVAFSSCGGAELGCVDDSGAGLYSLLSLTGQTPLSIIYIGVWKYGTVAPSITSKDFIISAYDASLANSSFDNANFSYYPNPVKNTLNLSYNKEISNVDVFNLLGQKVSSTKINSNNAQIDLSNLSKGAYMVKVTSDTQVKTIKVIKE